VLEGAAPFHVETTEVSVAELPQTRVMMNLGNPDLALQLSQLPADGVGLARMEFIITEYIGVHPLAALYPEKVEDATERAAVVARFEGYPDGRSYFVDRLCEGVATIAAAFYPRPVIIRLSDFKSNEYASLAGGRGFEPHEENPMIGFRGASRYIHPAYADGFALECEALVKVRDTLGLTNLEVMVPFCRRVDEAERVIEALARHGLIRGKNGLKVHVMCEIPNNVLLIDEFSKHFDGFSIGSNDLTQLTLGVDRDSAMVADRFDERDPGVLKILRMAVEGAKRNHRHVGICGQAPSDHPEIARFLVELGIDSLSLTPDRIQKTIVLVRDVERSLGRPQRG
jgi:pyruvate, water dikinase